jgi:hypothetical protein
MNPDIVHLAQDFASRQDALAFTSAAAAPPNDGGVPPVCALPPVRGREGLALTTQIKPEALWRAPESAVILRHLADQDFVSTLVETVDRVRPAAVALANALDSREPAALIGEAVLIERRLAPPADSLATDLLASSLLLEGAASDPTARVAVEYLRRRRQLEPLCWSKVAAALRLSVNDEPSAVALRS